MAENNHQRTLALRAPRGVVFDRDGTVLVENRHSYSISIVREHTKDLNRTIRLLAAVLGVDEARVREIVDRHRREPTYRPIIDRRRTRRWRRWRRSRRGGSTSSCPTSSSSRCRRGGIRDAMAAHLFGYVGEVNDAQVTDDDDAEERRHRRPVGHREGLQRAADGRGRRQARRRQQRRARDPDARRRCRRPKASALQLTIDYDVQKAVEDGFKASGFNGAAVVLDPQQRRSARRSRAAGLRPERLRRRHRSRDVGVAQHRRAAAAAGSRDSGTLLAGLDVQDGRRAGGARRRHHHAGLPGVLRRARELLRPRLQVLEEGRPRHRSICATRSSSRATCTSTRSATWSASTRSTSGRRCSASA